MRDNFATMLFTSCLTTLQSMTVPLSTSSESNTSRLLIRPELLELKKQLVDGNLIPTCLFGGPKSGKTTILHQLKEEILNSNLKNEYILVLVDFEQFDFTKNCNLPMLYREMIKTIGECIGRRTRTSFFLPCPSDENLSEYDFSITNPEGWSQWKLKKLFTNCFSYSDNRKIFMIVDGLDAIYVRAPDNTWAMELIKWLGELRRRMETFPYDRIHLLTAASIVTFDSSYSKPLHTQFNLFHIKSFDKTQIVELLSLYGYCRNSDKTSEMLIELFNGQPYLTKKAVEIATQIDDIFDLENLLLDEKSDFQELWKKIKTFLLSSIDNDYDIFKKLIDEILYPNQDHWTSHLNQYYNLLTTVGIIDFDMKISCSFFKKMLISEAEGFKDYEQKLPNPGRRC